MVVETYYILAVVIYLILSKFFTSVKFIPYYLGVFCTLLGLNLMNPAPGIVVFTIGLGLVLPLIELKTSSLLNSLLILIATVMAIGAETPSRLIACLSFLYFIRFSEVFITGMGEKMARDLLDFSVFLFVLTMIVIHNTFSLTTNTASILMLMALIISTIFSANNDKRNRVSNLISNLIAPLIFIKLIEKFSLSAPSEVTQLVISFLILLIIGKTIHMYLLKASKFNLSFVFSTNNFIIFLIACVSNYFSTTQLWSLILVNFIIFNLLNLKVRSNLIISVGECLLATLPLAALALSSAFSIDVLRSELGTGVLVVGGVLVCLPALIQINLVRGHHETV